MVPEVISKGSVDGSEVKQRVKGETVVLNYLEVKLAIEGRLFGHDSRAFVVYGHARGGTNILWNALGAHPRVLNCGHELNQLFAATVWFRLVRKLPWLMRVTWIRKVFSEHVTKSIWASLDNGCLGEIAPGEVYTVEQLAHAHVGYKGVNLDGGCHAALCGVHGEVVPIFLLRHPVGVLAGHVKRGFSFDVAAARYEQTLNKMLQLAESSQDFVAVDFANLVQAPFDVAELVFVQLNLSPASPHALRFKAKRRMSEDGHVVMEGLQENAHYWADRVEVGALLDPALKAPLPREVDLLGRASGFSESRLVQLVEQYEAALLTLHAEVVE